jgi:hypothetical protein
MELHEAISNFRADLATVKADGKDSVEITRLEDYLALLGSHAKESAAYRQQIHEAKLAEYRTEVAYGLENFRIVTAAGKDTLNAIILVNGGAAIALMAFLGNLGTVRIRTSGRGN